MRRIANPYTQRRLDLSLGDNSEIKQAAGLCRSGSVGSARLSAQKAVFSRSQRGFRADLVNSWP